MKRKIQITYMSHRGMGGHENIYPEQHWILFSELGASDFVGAIRIVRAEGFFREYGSGVKVYVPPTAILEMKEVSS